MECGNTRYIMRRNLQLLNVKHLWVYVYIMNGGCSDFLMYVAFVYSLLLRTFHNEARFITLLIHFSSGVQEKVYMAPSGAIIYLLFVIPSFSIEKTQG